VNAVIETGATWSFSSVRRAVTTISSSCPAPVEAAGWAACCALAPSNAENAQSADVQHRAATNLEVILIPSPLWPFPDRLCHGALRACCPDFSATVKATV
jgi:hypothetical protein